jgi:hypothetical protein
MENLESSKDAERNSVSNFLLDEFKIRIETYKNYLNLALQANVFFYVTTGAVLGFYLDRNKGLPNNTPLEYFLLLPILIGAVLGGIFIYAAKLQKKASTIIEEIRSESNEKGFRIAELPDINLLYLLLVIFGCIFFLVAISLIAVPHLLNTAKSNTSEGKHLMYFTGIAGGIVIVGGLSTYITQYLDEKLRKTKKSNMSNFSAEELALEKAGILRLPENQNLPESFWKEKRPSLKAETAIKTVIDERDED